ncbi:MAG: hypothetical protein SVO01_08095, partial [Thermotogota bacterium]|nr:hypothetical protein [Thermotogota bacterium]
GPDFEGLTSNTFLSYSLSLSYSYSPSPLISVYFSWRQEKYQKNRAPQLGLWLATPQAWLPSRERFFQPRK